MTDCTDYPAIAELSDVYLEDSYVLDVIEEPPVFKLKIEAVLTKDHPHYHAPDPTEKYCYATGWLVFRDVSRMEWGSRSVRRYTDAAGKEDMGNIDFLEFCGDHWHTGGDWGEVQIFTTARPQLTLTGESA